MGNISVGTLVLVTTVRELFFFLFTSEKLPLDAVAVGQEVRSNRPDETGGKRKNLKGGQTCQTRLLNN